MLIRPALTPCTYSLALIYTASSFWRVFRKGNLDPIAQRFAFGWIISGPLQIKDDGFSLHISVNHCTALQSLSTDLQRFWEIEELPFSQMLSLQKEQCETHFQNTHSRDASGRYIVRLPFKAPPPIAIGYSRDSPERMLQSLVRRFKSKPELKEEYQSFMREYEDLGHMRRVLNSQFTQYMPVYIPHHPMFRADSSHLRVVFNASSVTSNGTTLNEHLLAGPKLQSDLPFIILQWRQFRFVYTADIAKMYRQILIDSRDLDY